MRYAAALAICGLLSLLGLARAEESAAPAFVSPRPLEARKPIDGAKESATSAVSQNPPVKLHIQVVDVPLTKARDLGIDPTFTHGDDKTAAVIDSLRRNHLLTVLSEIDVSVGAGQSASFAIENSVAAADDDPGPRTRRTAVEVEATRLDAQEIRLDHLRVELTEKDSTANDVTTGSWRPRTTTIDTSFKLESGKALAMAGPVEGRTVKTMLKSAKHKPREKETIHELQTLYLITPEMATESKK